MLRSLFISLSQNQSLRHMMESSPLGRRISSRFVAGLHVEDALQVAAALNRQGISVTLDSLGENVASETEARTSAAIYHELIDAIPVRGLDANVSVKLTQMGMDLSPALAETIVSEMVEHAVSAKTFVRIDMEGTPYTEATIVMTERIFASMGHVGTVLQAYLFRTAEDVERLLRQGITMRLCKGAYKEGPELAFPKKEDVDANYVALMKKLATSGVFCGIATHDEKIVDEMKRFAREQKLGRDAFEFQMLYGVRRDLQRALVADGFRVRVYVPFGTEWYPYFMRRLAERPANVLFLAKNFFRS